MRSTAGARYLAESQIWLAHWREQRIDDRPAYPLLDRLSERSLAALAFWWTLHPRSSMESHAIAS